MTEEITVQDMVEKFWECVPHVWRHTRTEIRRIAYERYQMSEGQFQVLRRIRRGCSTVSSLAEVGGTGLPSVSKVVDTLVKRGYVNRLQNPGDRRKVPLALTDEGQEVMLDIYTEAESWLAARFNRLDQDQKEFFIKGLDAMNSSFEDTAAAQ